MTKPFTAKGCFTFGKFKGRSYAEIAFKEPGYVRWCKEKIDGFEAAAAAIGKPRPARAKAKPKAQPKPESLLDKLERNIDKINARAPKGMEQLDDETAFNPDAAPY